MNKYKVFLTVESKSLNLRGYLGYGWFTAEAASPEEAIELYTTVNTKAYSQALDDMTKPLFLLSAPNSLKIIVVPQQQFQSSIWNYSIRAELDEADPT